MQSEFDRLGIQFLKCNQFLEFEFGGKFGRNIMQFCSYSLNSHAANVKIELLKILLVDFCTIGSFLGDCLIREVDCSIRSTDCSIRLSQ